MKMKPIRTRLIALAAVCLLLATFAATPLSDKAIRDASPADTLQPTLRRKTVALVLGGGGAKGAAEVGVLRVLEEEGIPVDIVVGTSIGSIVGGFYAAGFPADSLDRLFREQDWGYLLSDREDPDDHSVINFKDGAPYLFGVRLWGRKKAESGVRGLRLGLVRGENILRFFREKLPEYEHLGSFDSLQRRYRAVAYDLKDMRETIISSGSLPLAMRASMSIPLVFQPVQADSMRLIDGGIVNNLPVDVARRMGAEVVIAVDLAVEGADLEREESFWESVRSKLGVSDRPKYVENRRDIDLYINPPLQGYGPESFSRDNVAAMIAIGEKAARAKTKEIRRFKRSLFVPLKQ